MKTKHPAKATVTVTREVTVPLPILLVVFIVLLTLKVSGVIDWSWWWVTAPLWAPVALLVVCAAGLFLLAGLVSVLLRKP